MRKNPKVLNARNEWGNMAMMIKAGYDPVKAGRLNIGRSDMMNAVKSVSDGTAIGIYRDNDKRFPYYSAQKKRHHGIQKNWKTCRYGMDLTLLR